MEAQQSSSTTNNINYPTPLPPNDIRLLTLGPGTGTDPLTCTLHPVSSLTARNTYEAISYVWGDPALTATIQCNGHPLAVTANLASALRQLRRPDLPRRLWADAVCINQADVEERSEQVARMGGVYERARGVLVCLGEEDEAGIARDCFALIRETNAVLGRLLREFGHWGRIPFLGVNGEIEDDLGRWAKLRTLSSLPWFQRLWVVQEAGLARGCVLHWGDDGATMAYAEYVELQLWLSKRPDVRRLVGAFSDVVCVECFEHVQCRMGNVATWRSGMPLAAYRAQAIRGIPSAFVNVLAAGRRLRATDPRDHVYGFIGNPLARNVGEEEQDGSGEGSLIVVPDYRKSWQQVYFDTACALLAHPREAPYLLSHVHHIGKEDAYGSDELPSWVPRWDQELAPAALGNPSHWFSAGGPVSDWSIQVNQHDKSLCVRGIVFDTVAWLSQPMLDRNLSIDPVEWEPNFRDGAPFIDVLYREVSSKWPGTPQDLDDAFPWAVAAGFAPWWQLDDTIELNQRFREHFEDYLEMVRNPTKEGEERDDHYGGLNYAFHLKHAHNRRLFITTSGKLGMGPLMARAGDVCCLVTGAPVPFLLRPIEAGGHHLVGECYVDGLMKSEDLGDRDGWEDFTIR